MLDYVFEPDQKGSYNLNPALDTLQYNWGGIMRNLSSTANNLVEENIEFIEFWLKVIDAPDGSKLYIDLGQITEDVIPNGQLDDEDVNENGNVDEGEDIGIDRLRDFEEEGYDPINNPDPAGDNFAYATGSTDYQRINGTQGNFELTRIPDSEDLNGNLTLDRVNSFFRYEVPIDTNRLTNPFIQGGGDNAGWYLFKVPLREYTAAVGQPSFTIVDFIRIFTVGNESSMHLRFNDINLVGNQWRKVLVPGYVDEDDTTLIVSTISFEENPEYVQPPGVSRERDRSNPDEEVLKNEQSLRLVINELHDGDKREIVKDLYRPLDLFNYKEMKFFVHGDEDDSYGSVSYFNDINDFGSEVYLRFGSDSLNFYEYRQPVKAGWNEVKITLSDLTSIKQLREDLTVLYKVPLENLPGHSYGIKGNPTLTSISFFAIGILNPNLNEARQQQPPNYYWVSGEIWVNELRVLGADDTKGWAYSTSTSLQMADLMTISFNLGQTDPYFHKLNERFGSRIDKRNWGTTVNFDALKLIPANLTGSNLKINYSRNESVAKPLYLPGTDILVDEAAQQLINKETANNISQEEANRKAEQLKSDAQTVNVSETWTLSGIKLRIPSREWYIRDIVNGFTFGFNYNVSEGRNPTTLSSKNWIWNASANYSLNLGKDNFFKFADIPILGALFELFDDYKDAKFYYTPQTLNTGFTATRKRNSSLSRTLGSEANVQRDFTASRNLGFNWKLTEGGLFNFDWTYSVDINSSLAHLLTLNDQERSNSEIFGDIFGGAFFGRDSRYVQNFDFKMNPKLPSFWNLNRFFNISGGYNVSYTWQYNFQQEELGRSAGFTNKINASMTLRLKSLSAPLFESEEQANGQQKNLPRGRGRGRERIIDDEVGNNQKNISNAADTTAVSDSLTVEAKPSPIKRALLFLRGAAKWLLFDYDQISFNFNQSNSQSGSGLAGEGTGFANFWGIKQDPNSGPSRLFMLGLSYDIGPRAPNGNLSDNFSQTNNFDFKTSRPLWEGAQLELNWKIGWGINKNTSIQTEPDGSIIVTNLTSTGSTDRSFLSLPPSLFLTVFKSGIKQVNELYNPNADNPNANLADAFVKGFESLPLLAKLPVFSDIAKYIPRPNWRINWSGLESFALFQNFAERVSLNHAYTSSYTEGWRITPDGLKETQTQKINYGFQPLVGLNITFKRIWDGNFTGNIKYATKTSYDLGISTRNITETFSRDITVSASFSKSGFEIPLFGLSLKNDIEISFSFTSSKNSTVLFEMDDFNEEGKPQDGTTRTTIEPRIKYVMSSRVTLTLFYRRSSVEPEGASRIPPTTTNEAGLDVHISIQ